MKNKDKKGTEFICNWDFFMRNQCARCPIKRKCDEFEENNKSKQNKKLSNIGKKTRKELLSNKRV